MFIKTPLFSGFYKLNVDAAGPIDRGKWSIGVMARDNEGVVVAASSWLYHWRLSWL